MCRNKHGRWHWYWVREGRAFEFYAKGRSGRTYFANLIYVGEAKPMRVPPNG